jgi:TIR domain
MSEVGTLEGHVFISYVREDYGRVNELCKILDGAGIPIWRDTADLWPGEDWRAKIREAITVNALVFLACFSQQSVNRVRSYQYEELILATEELRLRRPEQPWLIPVRFDECQIPDREIGSGRTLPHLQIADLFGNRYRENLERLVAAIQRILGHNSQPTAAQAAVLSTDRLAVEVKISGPDATDSGLHPTASTETIAGTSAAGAARGDSAVAAALTKPTSMHEGNLESGKYVIDVRGSRGVQIGDGNIQYNYSESSTGRNTQSDSNESHVEIG